MTINDLRQKNCLLFECISGSRAYGLDLPNSDTDIKGVFVLPKNDFYGLDYIDQINDDNNNCVFYELRRFVELLSKNNPNMLEMLSISPRHIIYQHPLFDYFTPQLFLSKLCKDSFAGYATSQIKKAKGLNKKINNPMSVERKNMLEFCYVPDKQGSMPVLTWLDKRKMNPNRCGLVNIANMRDMYALFYDARNVCGFRGLVSNNEATDLVLSNIPKDMLPIAYLSFNKDGYSTYCKDHREYWEWVKLRNDTRYQNTIEHGKNYDAKNMMHTFRLLDMASEILEHKQIIVYRPNREELLQIRSGAFLYEELIAKAQQKLNHIDQLYETTTLPNTPNKEQINELLAKVRTAFYG